MTFDYSRLALHIGLHKTATTHLQRNVFPHFGAGVRYAGASIAGSLWHLNLPHQQHVRVLLSSEQLSGDLIAPFPPTGEIRRNMLGMLAQAFPGARILLVLRHPAALVPSLYRQYLHQGGTLRFEDYWEHHDHHAFMFSRYVSHLYEQNFSLVEILDFDDMLRRPGDAVTRIEHLVGSTFSGDRESIFHMRRNVGVKGLGAQLLRRINRIRRSKYNPSGPLRLDRPWLRRLRLAPREAIQTGPLKVLNRLGRDVVSQADIARLHQQFDGDWQTTWEKVAHHRQQRAASP